MYTKWYYLAFAHDCVDEIKKYDAEDVMYALYFQTGGREEYPDYVKWRENQIEKYRQELEDDIVNKGYIEWVGI